MGASSLTKLINMNDTTEGNFAYDSGKIEFLADGVGLKLQENQETFQQLFTNDTGFTYDSSLAAFVAGVLQQVDKTPDNSVLAASYPTDANPITTEAALNWRNDAGSLAAILNGAPIIASGRLVCTGAQGAGYTRVSSAIETWFVDYIPNYSGAPPQNINILSCGGAGNNDRLNFTHSPSGDNLRINLYNSTGTNLISTATIGASSINLSSGTVYRFAVVVNSTAGTVSVYRKPGAGAWVLHGTLSPGAWTRGGVSRTYYVGAAPNSYNVAEASFDNFWVFSNSQNPVSSDITSAGIPLRKYLESKIDLPNFTFSGVGSIVSVDSATVVEGGAPHFIIAGRYWNGSIWAVSDGSYAQSSTSADVIANLVSFPATGATVVPVSVVFGNTNNQMSVDEFTVVVTGTTAYPLTSQKFEENAGQLMDALEDLELTDFDLEAGDAITLALKWAGQEYYWDGSAVSPSDGTDVQSNSVATILANKAAFTEALGLGAQVKLVFHLLSGDGTTTPKVRVVTLGFNFYNVQAEPPTCTIWGFYRDVSGKGVPDANITFSLVRSTGQYREAGSSIIEKSVTVVTDANGRFEVDLIRSSAFEGGNTYVLTISKSEGNLSTKYLNANRTPLTFLVPDQADEDITDLLTAAA